MAGAHWPRDLAGGGIAHDRVFEQRQLAVEQRDVNLLRLAGALAMQQCGVERDRGEQPAAQIANRGADAGQRHPRMAGDAHHPAEPLHHHVVGRIVGIGSGMTEARCRGIDQTRIARVQGIPAIAELFHRPRAEVLDQGVSLVEQPLENIAALRGFEVERDRFLAPVDRGEIGRFAIFERAVLARVVALLRRLDLDHPRAQLGHQHRAIGSREDAGEIDDGDAGKRPLLRHAC